MLVGAVNIHEPFAQRGKDVQSCWRTIDELPIRARIAERAFENKLGVFARFQTVLLEKGFERRFQGTNVEHCFDGTGFAATANERAIGAFAEDEIKCANEDGFARARFPGEDVVAGLEFDSEIRHQGKVFDAQRREHCSERNLEAWNP